MISVYTLIQDHDRSTAFHLACAVGALEIVKLFASKDPKICRITLIDTQGWTPLHLAALNNHPYVLKYLLEQVSSWTQSDNDVDDNNDDDDDDDDDGDKMEKAEEEDGDERWWYLPIELQMNKRTLKKLF